MDVDWIIFFAGVLNSLIGILVWKSNPKAKLNKFFGLFCLIVSVQIFFDFIFRFFPNLFILKCSYAFAALIPLAAILWISEICDFHITNKWLKILYFLPGLIFFVITFVDGLIVKEIKGLSILGYQGVIGPLFPAYTFLLAIYVVSFVVLLYRTQKKSDFVKKTQLNYTLCGILLYSGFGMIFSFILPIFFNNYDFTLLDAPSFIFFVGFTGYAITKHHLFDVRVIATELLTFAIWLILLIRTFLSVTPQDIAFNGAILIFVVFFGILLIRSVIREVGQREKIEKLAKDIEKAYEAEKLAKEKIDAIRVEDEALLASIGEGVVAIDREGKVTFINRAAEQMLYLKSEEAVGRSYGEILKMETEKGEAVLKEKDPLNLALSSGKKVITAVAEGTADIIYFYVRKDKTKFPSAITVAPVILNGKTIGAVDVFRDITVERQIDKSKTEFVSLASHQLRTPLSAIKWYSEIILGGKAGKLKPKQQEYLEQVYKGNERMIKLINVMLNISRLEAGKVKITLAPLSIRELLENIIAEQQVDIKKKKHKFTFECPNDLPKITTDSELIRMVFQNLISNAIKYTPDKGKIDCKIEKKDNSILFLVHDNGIGIPEDQQKKIFGKLFRADNAFSHDPQGNGLGLYAAKMTVENLGGKTWFESKADKGTTFYVELPMDK